MRKGLYKMSGLHTHIASGIEEEVGHRNGKY